MAFDSGRCLFLLLELQLRSVVCAFFFLAALFAFVLRLESFQVEIGNCVSVLSYQNHLQSNVEYTNDVKLVLSIFFPFLLGLKEAAGVSGKNGVMFFLLVMLAFFNLYNIQTKEMNYQLY